MNGYLITFCAGVAMLLTIIFASTETALFLGSAILCFWVGIMCVRSCLNFYADELEIDKRKKSIVKIDEHC